MSTISHQSVEIVDLKKKWISYRYVDINPWPYIIKDINKQNVEWITITSPEDLMSRLYDGLLPTTTNFVAAQMLIDQKSHHLIFYSQIVAHRVGPSPLSDMQKHQIIYQFEDEFYKNKNKNKNPYPDTTWTEVSNYKSNKSNKSDVSYKPIGDYIIQTLNQTYLTYHPETLTITFEPLIPLDSDVSFQQWKFYPSNENKNIIEIAPISNIKQVICFDDRQSQLNLKPLTTKTMTRFWHISKHINVINSNVYETTEFKNYKFSEISIITPFQSQVTDPLPQLVIQSNPTMKSIFKIQPKTNGIVSYDFDGVLHISVYPDAMFHKSLDRATYHPLEFYTSDLIPSKEMLLQLVDDHSQNYQIIIVTARPESSDKYVREFLTQYGVMDMIDSILYISDKTPFLKAINIVKHYDDSPKHLVPMAKAGLNAIRVDPKINEFWFWEKPMPQKGGRRKTKTKRMVKH